MTNLLVNSVKNHLKSLNLITFYFIHDYFFKINGLDTLKKSIYQIKLYFFYLSLKPSYRQYKEIKF